jgi:hypothetical protein
MGSVCLSVINQGPRGEVEEVKRIVTVFLVANRAPYHTTFTSELYRTGKHIICIVLEYTFGRVGS